MDLVQQKKEFDKIITVAIANTRLHRDIEIWAEGGSTIKY